jgi:hypothetical protein
VLGVPGEVHGIRSHGYHLGMVAAQRSRLAQTQEDSPIPCIRYHGAGPPDWNIERLASSPVLVNAVPRLSASP